jgi:hypothetical protein
MVSFRQTVSQKVAGAEGPELQEPNDKIKTTVKAGIRSSFMIDDCFCVVTKIGIENICSENSFIFGT